MLGVRLQKIVILEIFLKCPVTFFIVGVVRSVLSDSFFLLFCVFVGFLHFNVYFLSTFFVEIEIIHEFCVFLTCTRDIYDGSKLLDLVREKTPF